MQKVACIVAIALLLVTGVLGLGNGITELKDVLTPLQRSVTFTVLLYGVFGMSAAIGLVRRQSYSVGMAVVWAIAVMYAATVASFAYSDPTFSHSGTLAGTIAAGVATALIGWFVVW